VRLTSAAIDAQVDFTLRNVVGETGQELMFVLVATFHDERIVRNTARSLAGSPS
jgi:hypothetical protein